MGGGGGGGGEKEESNPDPPEIPGPCECNGHAKYEDPAHPWPADYGTYCRAWLSEYSCICTDECPDMKDDTWEDEWCEETYIFCFVQEDCPTSGDYAGQDDGERFWSTENCVAVETTEEPEEHDPDHDDHGEETTASP